MILDVGGWTGEAFTGVYVAGGSYVLTNPIINFVGNGLLRLFGIERRFGAQQYSSEELQDIVWESEEEGLLGPQSACPRPPACRQISERNAVGSRSGQ